MFGRFFKRAKVILSGEFVSLEGEQPAIDEATATARETLAVFWSVFDAAGADEFQLKVRLTTPNGASEHVWIAPRSRADGKIRGVLTVQPVDLEDVDLGDEVVVDEERISDWGYYKADRLYGAFTQRVMLDHAPPHVRRELEAVLSPTPLEPTH